MRKLIVSIAAIFVCATIAFAQESNASVKTKAKNKTTVSKQDNSANLESGTELTGELQNSLDVRNAKVGDEVVLKTTKAIKENGRTVLAKGTHLIGRVTDVQQKTKSNLMSSISIVFEKMESGSLIAPLSATITSINQSRTNVSANDDSIFAGSQTSSSTSERTSGSNSGGGGLISGVTNTVGNVVNSTTNTVGGVMNTTTKTAGSTVSNIRVTQSGSVSAGGGSTLWLEGNNLKIEKGTVFRLSLTESITIEDN